MKRWLIAFLVVAVSCQSVLSYGYQYSEECESFKYSLNEMNRLLVQEANNHKFNLNYERGGTYVSRTHYILKAFNDKLAKTYNQKSCGNGGNGFGCKQLEDEILAKAKEFGIEKIGLESNVIRLRKVLSYQDERNSFNENLLEESYNKTQTCVQSKSELESTNKSLDTKNTEQARKIKQLEEKIKSLEKETKRLQAKLNANAPAIHGETGHIYPEVNNTIPTTGADDPVITSTTEIAVPLVSRNATASVDENDESTSIPDIDLRASDGTSS